MIRLSAFGDEISDDLDKQIAVLQSENIHFLDLRGVWDTNVLDLTDQQVAEIKRLLDASGIRVSAIGSPIGKVPVDVPFDEHLQRFERAIELARAFQTSFIRIFSFYPPKSAEPGADPATYRDEVHARLHRLTARARQADIILLHENDTDLYGDTILRCMDVMMSIDDPHFGFLFDPANFIISGQEPYPDGYDALRPWLRYVHVKDATEDGTVTAAGEGAGRWPEFLERLRADGFDGTFALEPHLKSAGRHQGFSGPDRFRHASQTFQRLLREAGWNETS